MMILIINIATIAIVYVSSGYIQNGTIEIGSMMAFIQYMATILLSFLILLVIILNIPVLTEDTRRDYVKQAKQIAEEGRIALRNIRQDANNEIKKSELSEDEIKSLTDDVQELINKYNKEIDNKLKIKEEELMSI